MTPPMITPCQSLCRDSNSVEAPQRSEEALAVLGLSDAYEVLVLPRPAGHGATLFAGLSKHVDLELVSRLELGSGAIAMRYELRG